MSRRSERQKTTLRATAFHEAGHAIAAVREGIAFRRVTIVPSKTQNSLGHILFHKACPTFANEGELNYNQRRARRWLESKALVSYAGQIAEGIHRGTPPKWGFESDNEHMVRLAIEVCSSPESASAWLNWIFVSTTDMFKVESNWAAVEVVAERLLEKKTLSRKEVLGCFDVATDRWIQRKRDGQEAAESIRDSIQTETSD